MSTELATAIADAFWGAFGAELIGLFLLGCIIYFLAVNRADRGGLVLLGLLTTGYMAMSPLNGGYGMIDVWIWYVILAAVGIMAALGFMNTQRDG